MPPQPRKRCEPDALVTTGRAIALALCIALAGCQSNARHDDEDDMSLGRQVTQRADPIWLSDTVRPVVHEDIWERIRDGYQLQDYIDGNPRIEQQRLLFASRPANVEVATERGSPFIHYIVERLEEQNMPLELALLPVIESSYDPFAYSPAHAVGLWQFIPSTGRHFNLRQTNWYDGRRDITASTNAALRYLNYLHGLFNGDWLLALAAYNAGEGTVSRAIERNQRLGLPTDYWNLPLPSETRDYVPKLLALSQLIKTPESYGLSLSPIANEPYFEVVPLKQRMDLARVAKLADIDEDELIQLNPAFTRRITLDGPPQLLVPLSKAETLAANLARMKPQDLVDWQQYRVRPGDTLSGVAGRHQVSVRTLKEVNRLRSNTLRIGQTLTIPSASGSMPRLLDAVAARSGATTPRSYRVKPGDNLWDIAKSQGVSVRDLQAWNGLAGSQLKVGQALFLEKTAAGTKSKPTYYKVRSGDSLYEIARRFNVKIASLKNWNPHGTGILRPGQLLTLYLP